MLLKARVATQDISSIRSGQRGQLRVSACPYPEYGRLKGTVTAVSPDAIVGNRTDSESFAAASTATFFNSEKSRYYEIIIEPEQIVLRQGKRQCRLRAGMEAEATIIARQETILELALRKARLLSDL